MNQKIGAQLYTLRDYTKTEADFIFAMQKLQKSGFEYVQLSGVTADIKPERIREIADSCNIKIVCSHASWDRLLSEPEKIAEESICMGIPVVGLSYYPENGLENAAHFRQYLTRVENIGNIMKNYGLKFGIHNHAFELQRFGGKTILQHTRENTDPDAVEFIFCCYWAQFAGADPVQYIYEFKDRITCCHYKDMTAISGQPTFTTVGNGNMNYKAIWRACEETGVKYALIEQDICEKDPFECLVDSRDYIVSLDK